MKRCVALAVAMGREVWPDTYQKGITRSAALAVLEGPPRSVPPSTSPFVSLCAEWYDRALPRVVVGHRLAASLACTTMRDDDVPELRAPWSVFMLDVPSGMLHDDWGVEVSCILVFDIVEPTSRTVGALALPENPDHTMTWLAVADNIADLPEDRLANAWQKLATRLVVGVVAELGAHRAAQAAAGRGEIKRNARGEPETRTFTLQRDVKVDCRAAVAEFLAGTKGRRGSAKAAPTVQCLVRGHWRRVVVARGSEARRWTHVEPYWKGPEDAPIALRAHALVDPSRAAGTGEDPPEESP